MQHFKIRELENSFSDVMNRLLEHEQHDLPALTAVLTPVLTPFLTDLKIDVNSKVGKSGIPKSELDNSFLTTEVETEDFCGVEGGGGGFGCCCDIIFFFLFYTICHSNNRSS